jgi:hypothetical protein
LPEGQTNFLQSPLTRAVFFSALMTATAFGSLSFSSNPGMSSMGKLLALSLACRLAGDVGEDTVVAAHKAFTGLSFTGTGAHKWSVQFDDRKTYVTNENSLKEEQLVKAGARLADLLDETYRGGWSDSAIAFFQLRPRGFPGGAIFVLREAADGGGLFEIQGITEVSAAGINIPAPPASRRASGDEEPSRKDGG